MIKLSARINFNINPHNHFKLQFNLSFKWTTCSKWTWGAKICFHLMCKAPRIINKCLTNSSLTTSLKWSRPVILDLKCKTNSITVVLSKITSIKDKIKWCNFYSNKWWMEEIIRIFKCKCFSKWCSKIVSKTTLREIINYLILLLIDLVSHNQTIPCLTWINKTFYRTLWVWIIIVLLILNLINKRWISKAFQACNHFKWARIKIFKILPWNHKDYKMIDNLILYKQTNSTVSCNKTLHL